MAGEQHSRIAKHRQECICDPCPSYNECMRADEHLLFCIEGKDEHCTFEKKGCACPSCPVKKTLGLTGAYFCIRGSGKEQQKAR